MELKEISITTPSQSFSQSTLLISTCNSHVMHWTCLPGLDLAPCILIRGYPRFYSQRLIDWTQVWHLSQALPLAAFTQQAKLINFSHITFFDEKPKSRSSTTGVWKKHLWSFWNTWWTFTSICGEKACSRNFGAILCVPWLYSLPCDPMQNSDKSHVHTTHQTIGMSKHQHVLMGFPVV